MQYERLTNSRINTQTKTQKYERGEKMTNSIFLSAQEVADMLNISKPYAYKIINRLNRELEDRNFITIPGRVSKKYFEEKFYGIDIIKCQVFMYKKSYIKMYNYSVCFK